MNDFLPDFDEWAGFVSSLSDVIDLDASAREPELSYAAAKLQMRNHFYGLRCFMDLVGFRCGLRRLGQLRQGLRICPMLVF